MSPQPGYLRHPAIYGDRIVFVCEDDLWQVPATGGRAVRLTANLGAASCPAFSPDGKWLAFTASNEGHSEIYRMPAAGGHATRLTHLAAASYACGFSPDSQRIWFASNAHQPFARQLSLFSIDGDGGLPEQWSGGPAVHVDHRDASVVIARFCRDPARWKRYRGGLAGDLWIDSEGSGQFTRLISLPGNLSSPLFVGDRVFFVSDHEGVGNLYSCSPDGQDLQRHSDHNDFYARFPSSDGSCVVYHAGADIYRLDPGAESATRVEIDMRSPQTQRQRKFVSASKYLQDYALHPDGHSLAVISRGRPYTMGNWEGPALQHGDTQGTRYRLARYLNDGERLVMVSDAGGEEALEIHHLDGSAPRRLEGLDLGRPIALEVSPKADAIALANHRFELIHVNLESGESRVLDCSHYDRIADFAWSPDGAWLAYGFGVSRETHAIKLCELSSGETHVVTDPLRYDVAPVFDPKGRYLYFLSYRSFNPVYDNLHFDLSFPRGVLPCLITLQRDLPSPFLPQPQALNEKNGDKKEEDKDAPIQIDLDGICNRTVAFPVPEDRYVGIDATADKLLLAAVPVEGTLRPANSTRTPRGRIAAFDFKTQKLEVIVRKVSSFGVGRDHKTLIYRSGDRLRVVKAGQKPDDKGDGANRESGWLDLARLWVSVDPGTEWAQMLREIWRLQRDHFWVANMSDVDWEHVYERYQPLVERIASRGEFSDLVWEMQGELGTSHAYEMGGDYRKPPVYSQGLLAADFSYDEEGRCEILRAVQGDSWAAGKDSPLNAPGVNLAAGDRLVAINGQPVDRQHTPAVRLVNQARREVALRIASADGELRTVTVKALASETPARYREWVDSNRERVHRESKGRVGYVHIPDMGPAGYAEFHRSYLAEVEHEALIVDVRCNGGGHVSQLILEKVARRHLGYCMHRWGEHNSYPEHAVAGPIVAVTNEFAGSDGDIFSHCFKLLGVGTLIGKRTWGGVIGISPRHSLVDGSRTTQPEFSYWFKDVGWQVENYGTDPNIEIEIAPQDYAAGRDPQLSRAMAEVLAQLAATPPSCPNFVDKPTLALPKLPPRP
jgi:tricorn protease